MDETTETAVSSSIHIVDDNFPGSKTRAALERGIALSKNGLRFDAEMERAGRRGFRPVRQIVVDRAKVTSDRQDTIRMYPALNMDESVLREGLKTMEDAIGHVEEHGHTEGDATAYPCGASGY